MIKEQKNITTEEIANKAKSALGNGRGTFILAVLGITISLGSSFMFCLASIGFDFTQLQLAEFWSRWACMSLSTLFTYVLVIIHKDEVNRLNVWYTDNLKLLADKSATVGTEFEVYLKELNLQRRIDWHKRNVNEKMAALNKKLLRLELKNKPTKRIEDKIRTYKYSLSDEYIEANKYALKTRSKPISSAQVLCETRRGDGGEENFRSAAVYYSGKVISKLIFSLLLTASFASVVVQNFVAGINVASVAMTVLTVFSLLISVVSAILAANGCYRNVYVPNLQFKLKILAGFDNWLKK